MQISRKMHSTINCQQYHEIKVAGTAQSGSQSRQHINHLSISTECKSTVSISWVYLHGVSCALAIKHSIIQSVHVAFYIDCNCFNSAFFFFFHVSLLLDVIRLLAYLRSISPSFIQSVAQFLLLCKDSSN